MKNLRNICFIICVLILAGCHGAESMLGHDEIGSKSEYSILQKVEYENRQKNISQPEIIRTDGYLIAGFRLQSGRGNTWILLNAKHSPYYKQMPQGNFTLTARELDTIRRIEGTSSTVISVLESRIDRSSASIGDEK